jgi:ElaB/YqjD/DUF883 family membrane-anchored ribosome-binding protein
MNDQQLEHKVRKDADRVKKDINTLVQDSIAQLNRVESSLSKATGKTKEDLTTWAEDGVSHLSKGIDKLSGDARETMGDTASTVKKDVGHRLSQYNAKVKEIAGQVPNDFGKKVARYPWVAISIGLFVGFLVGMIFRPVPQTA